ncbi:MAG TPA: hypothetical protein VNK04_08755 [Gemmataceae bacterium]|nr:hypothetical protein [Gemmataceae bacterium]
MSTKRLIGLAVGAAAAILCAACAPVDPPAPRPEETPPSEQAPVEKLTLMPTPAPEPTGPKDRIEAAIEHVRRRDLRTSNGFWTVFHGILGLGPSVTLLNEDTGQRVNAVDYIANGGELRGLVFLPTKYGLDVQSFADGQGVGQGHQDQFIAEMAQWGMPPDKKFVVFGRDYTFMDFVRHAQMRARVTQKQELSWAILVIGQYLGTDISWTNGHGEQLHFEDLVRYELDASVENAPCGGTHRLFGLTWVYHLHLQKGGAKTGVWKEIADKTAKYRDLAKKYQNPDGSFSTSFFRGPGNAADKQLRINTTGHTLEWLALALSPDELKEPWMQEAANALALMILEMQGSPIEGGSLYHAVHGLLIYYARVYDRHWLGPNEPPIPLPPEWAPAEGE